MYAMIRSGGKQVRVSPGQAVCGRRAHAGAVGEAITLAEVLMVGGEGGAAVGTPLVAGASVVGTITAQDRGPKITIFDMKRRKGATAAKLGHRQSFTEIRVERIEG